MGRTLFSFSFLGVKRRTDQKLRLTATADFIVTQLQAPNSKLQTPTPFITILSDFLFGRSFGVQLLRMRNDDYTLDGGGKMTHYVLGSKFPPLWSNWRDMIG